MLDAYDIGQWCRYDDYCSECQNHEGNFGPHEVEIPVSVIYKILED